MIWESEDLFERSEEDFEVEPIDPEVDFEYDKRPMRSEEEYPQRVTLPIERPQLVVSEENSCDSNATTIAIDDRDILEWNDDQDESTLPYSQSDEGSNDHDESTLPYLQHDGEGQLSIREVVWLDEWLQRSDYWMRTLKGLPQQTTQELVGTPTETKGGRGT